MDQTKEQTQNLMASMQEDLGGVLNRAVDVVKSYGLPMDSFTLVARKADQPGMTVVLGNEPVVKAAELAEAVRFHMTGEPPAVLGGSGAYRIARERQRQVDAEGHSAGGDDLYTDQQLLRAALGYAHLPVKCPRFDEAATPPFDFPWDARHWKPSDDPIRNLEIAGALIAAELDRLERSAGDAPTASMPVVRTPQLRVEYGSTDESWRKEEGERAGFYTALVRVADDEPLLTDVCARFEIACKTAQELAGSIGCHRVVKHLGVGEEEDAPDGE